MDEKADINVASLYTNSLSMQQWGDGRKYCSSMETTFICYINWSYRYAITKKHGLLTDELFDKTCIEINNNAQYLSKTIEDFKNFIRNDRTKVTFNLSEDINSFLELVRGSIKNHDINLILDLKDDIIIDGYPNELIQCLINIFNNSKDALIERIIKDNAGGISKKAFPRIFEPYFTTKYKPIGTGIGLSMIYNLIVEGMNGSIKDDNVSFIYHN